MATFRYLPKPVRRWIVHVAAPSFSVGAVALLRRPDGRVVLVEQRHTGGWALPGGLLMRGERPDDAIVREVAEEVGLRLNVADLPVPLAAVDPRVRRVDLVYVLDAPGDAQPQRTDFAEVRRVDWFPLDQLPPVTDPTLFILRAVRLL